MALPPASNTGSTDKASASKAAQDDVFLREVDDALRQDQFEGFFKRWGVLVLGVIGVGLIAFGGYLYWEHREAKAREERSEQIVLAIDDIEIANFSQAKEKLDPIAAEGGAQGAIAKLLLAGSALRQNDEAAARKLYAEVAASDDVPQEMRDLATIREVSASFDTMKPQDIVSRLKPLAMPQSPWFGVAGEMLAFAYLEQGKPKEAGPLLVSISEDDSLPESLRGRTRQLAATLGFDSLPDTVDARGEPIETIRQVGKTTVTEK